MESVNYDPLSFNQSSQSAQHVQECFLQGSVFDKSVDQLHERLQGLCENVTPEALMEHEKTYNMKQPNSSQPIVVKVVKAHLRGSFPIQMKYCGTVDGANTKSKLANSRTVVTVACNKDPDEFLKQLGFTMMFEAQIKGHFYRKGHIKVVVAKLVNITKTFDQSKLDKVNTSHIVEASLSSSSRDDRAAEELSRFAQGLKPIVNLEKMDLRTIMGAFK